MLLVVIVVSAMIVEAVMADGIAVAVNVAAVIVNAADGMMRCGSGLLRVAFVAVVRLARVRALIWRLL